MRKTIIKEGPMVFFQKIVMMEVLAGLIFFIASYLENYEALYKGWGFAEYLRYDLFSVFVFSVFQLVYITLIFAEWYFSYYEIGEHSIVRKTGLVFRRRKSIKISDVVSVELYQSPLDRLIKHATIILEHKEGNKTKIRNVPNFDEHLYIIERAIPSPLEKTSNIFSLIESGESMNLEFKQTLRYDIRKKQPSKEIEYSNLKTITGFLNSEGGMLIIGVSDSKEISGLEMDYSTLQKKDRDGFENHLNNLIKASIGINVVNYVSIKFEKLKEKEVCIVSVKPSSKPVYLSGSDGKEQFFVRLNNSSHPFSMSEAQEYIKSRWK